MNLHKKPHSIDIKHLVCMREIYHPAVMTHQQTSLANKECSQGRLARLWNIQQMEHVISTINICVTM